MKFLNKVQKGKVKKPPRIFLYGISGIGKTTFGAGAENPIFVGGEDGANSLNVDKMPKVSTFNEVFAQLTELVNESHDYKTVVIDTLDSLEGLAWQQIMQMSGAKSIETASGGYGKGYLAAAHLFEDVRTLLDQLRDKGITVIVLAHSQVVKFCDPVTNVEYDTYKPKLHKKACAVFTEWADVLAFTNFEIYSAENKKGETKAYGDGKRMLFTESRPSFEAKNRYCLPFQMDLDYKQMRSAIDLFLTDHEEIEVHVEDPATKINELIFLINNKIERLNPNIQEIVKNTALEAGQDYEQLIIIDNRINEILGGF